jgi:hypothetical protein
VHEVVSNEMDGINYNFYFFYFTLPTTTDLPP